MFRMFELVDERDGVVLHRDPALACRINEKLVFAKAEFPRALARRELRGPLYASGNPGVSTSALPGATSRLPAPPTTALGEEHKAVLRAAEPRERDTAGAVVGQLVPGALLEIAVGHRDDSRSRPISL